MSRTYHDLFAADKSFYAVSYDKFDLVVMNVVKAYLSSCFYDGFGYGMKIMFLRAGG